MKTLKIITVAILLLSSLAVFSKPIPTAKSTIEAQNDLLMKVKFKIKKLDLTDNIEKGCTKEFMVYCTVNEQNHLKIVKIDGEMESLKQNITSIIEKQPIEVSSLLKGKIYSFKLSLINK